MFIYLEMKKGTGKLLSGGLNVHFTCMKIQGTQFMQKAPKCTGKPRSTLQKRKRRRRRDKFYVSVRWLPVYFFYHNAVVILEFQNNPTALFEKSQIACTFGIGAKPLIEETKREGKWERTSERLFNKDVFWKGKRGKGKKRRRVCHNNLAFFTNWNPYSQLNLDFILIHRAPSLPGFRRSLMSSLLLNRWLLLTSLPSFSPSPLLFKVVVSQDSDLCALPFSIYAHSLVILSDIMALNMSRLIISKITSPAQIAPQNSRLIYNCPLETFTWMSHSHLTQDASNADS